MDTTIIPLTEVDPTTLEQFANELMNVPRSFGPGSMPKPSVRWRSVLSHPSRVRGAAAMIGDELAGVARLVPRPVARSDLYVAVAPPHRGHGLATRLVRAAIDLATASGERGLVMIVEHRKAPVRALARHFGAEPPSIDDHGQLEIFLRLAS
jgi:GNAT superfamily N-acetyltransferase